MLEVSAGRRHWAAHGPQGRPTYGDLGLPLRTPHRFVTFIIEVRRIP